MALLSLKAAHLRFTMAKILMGVDLEIDEGERIGLLGRNGAGKSTLMKVLLGQAELDQGEVIRRAGITVAALPQDVPAWLTGRLAPLLESVANGVPGLKEWEKKRRIEEAMKVLDLAGDEDLTHSSAGTKRRALLATLMAREPDVLFLDEPTNHLDIPGIRSLEEWLLKRGGALVFVTHDRRFLRRVATRILDLDRGELRSYTCGYATYLERREEELRVEEETRQQFDKKLAVEEAWIRKGVKAQRGRSAARIAALKAMRAERAVRREQVGSVQGQIQVAGKTGQLVLRAKNLGVSFDGRPVFRGLTTDLLRGDRLGIIGRNGAGKTTLLKALLLEIPATEGEVVHGTNLKIGVLDQLHEGLRMDASAMDNVLDGATTIPVPGGTKHVLGYLQDFLFTPE
ncbi:MAG TPA: ATP-binding cassette domain-containing protein, partial [Planctomycetota bacterium]|nr:ATP-binding cassette domain-containing protein [Planctomycetota bacterium]